MDVNGLIALYTTLFGWQFYDVIWTVLVGTGLAYLPILGAVFDGLMQSRSSASAMSADADSALAMIEVNVFKIFLVMVLAVIPTGLTTLSANELRYEGFTPSNTSSTYDDTFATSPLVTGASVQVPAWWYWTMSTSQGLTKAVVKAAGDDNVYRDLELAVSIASIRDPSTRYQLQVFNNECHIPARSQYYRQTANSTQTSDDDVHWPGSSYLFDTPGYYDALTTRTVLPGYAFTTTAMPEYDSNPNLGGRPDCKTFWADVSDAVYLEAERDNVPSWWEKLTGGISAADKANIVNRYVQTERFDVLQNADEINSIRTQDSGIMQRGIELIGGTASAIGMAKDIFYLRSAVNSVVYGGEVIQSYILMVLYLFIPIGMLISRYSFGFLVSGAVLIFTVTFWTALWAIAAQADHFLTQAMWGQSFTEKIVNFTDPENVMKDLVHSIVVLGLYLLLPISATWILVAAGHSAVGQVGRGLAGSSIGSIGSSGRGGIGYVDAAGKRTGRFIRGNHKQSKP